MRPTTVSHFNWLAELAWTVEQFHILMDRRNWAGQIVRPSKWNSQGEETNRSFDLADGILKVKRRSVGGPARGGDWRGWGQHGWGRIGGGGSSTGGGVKGGVFFFFFFLVFFWVLPHFLGGGWSGVATGYLHSYLKRTKRIEVFTSVGQLLF